ncbi:hypothetical protein FE257_006747 [Aspergillus nanangensis]|uniref:Fumarylacetoacetase-like C-terminal domain-containing protein n=1 Tax=Aspergillus nanangensis TaxID=2582783 RepID=A0AAD4GUT0_ASPNN|nr:hypothetical protein FE257_006747 [Aspergillus nanangensis]
MSWSRYIRFRDDNGTTRQDEPQIESADELLILLSRGELFAWEISGNDLYKATVTDKKFHVKELLGPLAPADVPILRCVGLNYATHIKELGRTPPPYPSIFIKPSHSVSGWKSSIPIPRIAQEDQMDYEGELAILIGAEGKDIRPADALDYVAGYLVANDLSARAWQRDPKYAGNVPQWCFGKGFDGFAPLGPMIVSHKLGDELTMFVSFPPLLQDSRGGRYSLPVDKVNGTVRQQANTADLVFGVREIIAFASQGATLVKDSVILAGTPGGVILGSVKPKWLVDGDVVQVSISGIGSIRNKMAFL